LLEGRALQEIIERRTRHAKHYDLGNGEYKAVIGRNLHYWDNGWQDVAPGFRAQAGGPISDKHEYTAIATPTGFILRDRATNKGIRWTHAGGYTVNGKRAAFTKHGLSWEYTLRKSGVKLSATVAAPRGPQTYAWGYQLLGGAAALTVDQSGQLVSDTFTIAAPVAIGANRETYPAGSWTVAAGTASFTFDDSSLPAEAFPYELDPTTTFSVAASGDDVQYGNWLNGSYPPDNNNFFTDTTTATPPSRDAWTGVFYAFYITALSWDTSSLNDAATITGANLKIVVSSKVDANSRSIGGEWHTFSAWPPAQADYSRPIGTTAFGPTTIASLTAGNTENTFALSSPTTISKTGTTRMRIGSTSSTQPTGDNAVYFIGYDHATLAEPKLEVTYTLPATKSGRTGLSGISGISI
jgi:hypothetical protein